MQPLRTYLLYVSVAYLQITTIDVGTCATEAIFCCPTENSQSPRSLISIKRSAVQRGERISKKNDEMSYNFEEIIKNYIRCFKKPSQAAIQGFPPPPPHLLASCDGGFSTGWRKMCQMQAPFSLARFTREMEGGGQGDLRIDTIQ